MVSLISKLKKVLMTTNWKKTSLCSVISGGLFLVLLPVYLANGEGFELLCAIFGVFALSQLAAWFGGLFRAVFGAIAMISSVAMLAFFATTLPRIGEFPTKEAPMVIVIMLFLVSLPILMRAELYRKDSSKPERIAEL